MLSLQLQSSNCFPGMAPYPALSPQHCPLSDSSAPVLAEGHSALLSKLPTTSCPSTCKSLSSPCLLANSNTGGNLSFSRQGSYRNLQVQACMCMCVCSWFPLLGESSGWAHRSIDWQVPGQLWALASGLVSTHPQVPTTSPLLSSQKNLRLPSGGWSFPQRTGFTSPLEISRGA